MRESFTLHTPDGIELFCYQWSPDGEAKAIVQIAHGAAEHAERYDRFANFLTENGFVVYADNHRGHYKTAGSLENAGKVSQDSWKGMVRDLKQLTDHARQENPGLPLFFFGHSMGSMLGQHYAQEYGDGLQGLVLSGPLGGLEGIEALVAAAEQASATGGRDAMSELFIGMFTSFNEGFEQRTGFEWLSRDEAEVQKYVDDPWSGFPFSNGLVEDFMKGAQHLWNSANEQKIPSDLPVLTITGEQDPASGGGQTVRMLAERYKSYGIHDITEIYYPEARHEVLNETNREQVMQDVMDWMNEHL
jgi:alpha-beta hydrolase superfamily lysophospholipase